MQGPIDTARLRLRPFEAEDLDDLAAMWSDPEVGPWIGGAHTERRRSVDTLVAHLDHQRRHGYAFWAVEERETGRLVGEIGLMLFEGCGPEIETGWCIARDAWGKGYAQEAARRWLEIGFGDLGFDRIVAVVLPANERSIRVCESLGMRPAGTRHAYGREHLLFELGAEEFSRG